MHTHHHKHATQAQPGPTRPTTRLQPAAARGDNNHIAQSVSAQTIRLRAYQKWECAGRPAGNGVRFWLEAEKELVTGILGH
jgi:hypothetical protein